MDLVPMSVFQPVGALWLPPQAAKAPKLEPPTIRMAGGRRMQCKDIPDEVFLDAVRRTPAVDGSLAPEAWRMRWEVQAELEKTLGAIPGNLFMAKARRLCARRLLGGCDCGCRGDWHVAADCPWPDCCPPRGV